MPSSVFALIRGLRSITTRSDVLASFLSSCLLIVAGLSGCSSQTESSDRSSPVTRLGEPATTHSVSLEVRQDQVIYGEDTRRDLYEVDDPELERLARRSIMAMFSENALQANDDGSITVRGNTLGSRYGLCEDQRYRDQPAASSCSATLVDDDLIVTAGHCIETQDECESKRFVLGYAMNSEDELASLTSDQVFSCRQLVLSVNTNSLDYAFVRLDRAVNPMFAEPAPVTQSVEPLAQDEPIVMMGFPSGLPLKIDGGGFVNDPRADVSPLTYFRATVDAFGGNSGSGVFNESGEQVGILVRGETDYIPSQLGCTVVNELNLDRGPGEEAEELTYLSRALTALCDTEYPSDRLCGQSLRGLCFDCELDSECIPGYRCGRFDRYPEAPTFCAPGCSADAPDCPDGHTCISGQCTPSESRDCDGDQVVAVDSCQRLLGLVETCGEGQYCRRGSCLETSPGDTCADALPLEVTDQQLRGTFQEGFTSTASGSCGGRGPEIFYRFELAQPNRLIATATGMDTVLYLRQSCDLGDELACVDDSRPPGRYGSRIDTRLEAGDYYLALDSYRSEERGDYELTLDFCDSVCAIGDRRCSREGAAPTEVCIADEDGCSTWVADEPCAGDQVCRQGACIDPPAADTCTSAPRIEQTLPEQEWAWVEQWTPESTLAAGSACTPDAQADALYRITLTTSSFLSATLSGERALGLALYEGCPRAQPSSGELTCAVGQEDAHTLNVELARGEYTLVALGADASLYELSLELSPVCMDECVLELEPYCVEFMDERDNLIEGVSACVVGPQGCTVLDVVERCEDQVCAGGVCQEACFDACAIGESYCEDLSSPVSCLADERGCAIWVDQEPCGSGEVCAGEGRCISESMDWGVVDMTPEPDMIGAGFEAGAEAGFEGGAEAGEIPRPTPPPPPPSDWVGYNGPREVRLPPRIRGGCQSASHHDSRSSLSCLILLGWVLLRVRRFHKRSLD